MVMLGSVGQAGSMLIALQPGRPALRPRIWKLMLKVESLNTDEYLRWVTMGPSAVSTKSELSSP